MAKIAFSSHELLLGFLITWACSLQPLNTQLTPILSVENILNKIHSKFPHLQDQSQVLRNFMVEGAENREFIQKGLAKILKNPSIFSLWGQIEETEGLLDLIFKNVTETCSEQFEYALGKISFPSSVPEAWVLQMFDSYGKIPSGIFSGHTSEPGDFHECVQIKSEFTSTVSKETQVVEGRYVSTYLLPGPALFEALTPVNQSTFNGIRSEIQEAVSLEQLLTFMLDTSTLPIMLPMMGTCFPKSCSPEDIQQIFNSFHTHVSRDFLSQAVISTHINEKPSLNGGSIVMIVVLVIIGTFCLAGTYLDIRLPSHGKPKAGNLPLRILLTFSFYTNTKKWLSMNTGMDNLSCLHGLRFLSMAWVVLCHTFIMLVFQLNWNLIDVKNVSGFLFLVEYGFIGFFGYGMEDHDREEIGNQLERDVQGLVPAAPILNRTPSVDTFFTLSGTLVAYHLLKELERQKGRFNYILFVIHRFLRLTPTYVILMGIMATLMPYAGSGPNWNQIESESTQCSKYWWHNMLYINNLITYEVGGCYGEAWYLANDKQFYLLSPLLIYPLWRRKRIGLGLVGILSVVSVIVPAWIVAENNLTPTFVYSMITNNYMKDVYSKPWTRFGAYVIGILLGYVLYYRGNNLAKFRSIPKWIIVLGWTVSTILAVGIIFGGLYYFDPENLEETLSSFHATAYAGLHRPLWGVVIAWIIFACVSGYGGWVNKLLSLKIFMPLGRLTFCMYITSFHIQLIYHVSLPHSVHYSKYSTVNLYFAHMMMSGLVAYFLTMSLESPFMQIEKMIFASHKPSTLGAAQPSKERNEAVDVNGNDFDVKVDKRNGNS